MFDVFLIASVFSTPALAQSETSIDCLAYWQVKSIALSQEHSISSATLSEQYEASYQQAKNDLLAKVDKQELTMQLHEQMKEIMTVLNNDLSKHSALNKTYADTCPPENKTGS